MKKRSREAQPRKPKDFENRPFAALAKERRPLESPSPPPPPAPPEPAAESEEALFRRAVAGARPLGSGLAPLVPIEPKARPPRPDTHEDDVVMQELEDLVAGEIPFDLNDSDEYIEGAVSGFSRRELGRLRRGELSWQAHLDLHGLHRDEARARVGEFINACQRDGKRCVLIVTGRGLNSKDNVPVLKSRIVAWLTRASIGRKVLAFTSARPTDGGTGAVYVLLRG